LIKIEKSNDPEGWKDVVNTDGRADYINIPELRIARSALIREQGYLCAYCMQRIKFDEEQNTHNSKIEHIISRDDLGSHESYQDDPKREWRYENWALCCEGITDGEEHCDTLKKGFSLSFDLYSDHLENSISYGSKNGEIRSSNEVWNAEMTANSKGCLHLNQRLLMKNRFEALNGVRFFLDRRGWKKSNFEMLLQSTFRRNKDNKFQPYVGIIRWYMKRLLRQAS